ncbi:MAG TPA: hypothetical protein VJB69_01975 [Candidatus Paceibacterota bacterium]
MKTFLTLIFIFGLVATAPSAAHSATANTVDLLWEGKTYVPTLYAGRPLPTPGNLVRVVAIPNVVISGQRLRADQLIFTWVKDFNPIQSASGQGKDVLEYRADSGGAPSIVSVEVSIPAGEPLTETRITITPAKTKLVLSSVSPLTNPNRARALTDIISLSPAETTLIAQPFFFSPLDLTNRQIIFDWRVNGERAPTQREDGRFFTLAANDRAGSGEIKLSVTARKESVPLQTASRAVTLGFGLQNFTF